MARVGIEPDRRAFHPHITLARLGRSYGPADGFLARSGTVSTAPFRLDAFGLYESRLTPEGAVYTELEAYPLG
jgi:2'-5' RNA ligase